MAQDQFGNPITARRPETIAAIDDFAQGFLGYDRRILTILSVANDDEDCLANTYAGLLLMLSELGAIPDDARRYLDRAERGEAGATDRERGALHALRHWIAGDLPASLAVIERVLAEHPRDLVLLKLHQYHDFNSGDFPAMLRVALASLDAAADVASVHGMVAFAYEQCHLLDKAEQAARIALGMQATEPWAQHALAHVMLTQGRIDEGAAFLESKRDSWEGLTSFMYTHHWWHLALFYLSQGRNEDALAAYDEHCWLTQRDSSQDQIGAVSLLARFEFARIDIGQRWQEVGDYLAARAADVTTPFLSLQYLYGLARAGRPEAASLLDAIRTVADAGTGAGRDVWGQVALPIAEGLAAHAAGDYEQALRLLEPPLGRLGEIGGSHAQRDLFEQITLDCLLRTGRLGRAQQVLEVRRGFDPVGVALNTMLAGVYAGLGLAALADEATQRASETRTRVRRERERQPGDPALSPQPLLSRVPAE